MSGFAEEGGRAIACFARDLPAMDRNFDAIADPEWTGYKKGGSGNLDMLCNAPAYAYAETSVAKLFWRDSWTAFFRDNQESFQRNEPLSVIYSVLHVLGVLTVYRAARRFGSGHEELEMLALQWLKQWWAICRFSETTLEGGRPYLLLAGCRSSGVPMVNHFGHHSLWAEALGKDWQGREESLDRELADVLQEDVNGWIDVATAHLSPEIIATAANAVDDDLDQVFQDLTIPFRTDVHFFRGEDETYFWMGDDNETTDDDLNNNTLGVLALGHDMVEDELWSLPPNMGPHYRQKYTMASCYRRYAGISGWQVVYFNNDPDIGNSIRQLRPIRSDDNAIEVHCIGGRWTYVELGGASVYDEPDPDANSGPDIIQDPNTPGTWWVKQPRKVSGWKKLWAWFKSLFK